MLRDGVAIGAMTSAGNELRLCVAYRFSEDLTMPLVAVQ